MTKHEFLKAFHAMIEFYGKEGEYTEKKLALIYSRFQVYDIAPFKKAIGVFVDQQEYLPANPIPILLRYLGQAHDATTAEKTIHRLLKVVRSIGIYQTPTDKLCQYYGVEPLTDMEKYIISDLGGWKEVCAMTDESLGWAVKNLLKGHYQPRGDVPQLQGMHAEQNDRKRLTQNLADTLQEMKTEDEDAS